MWGIYVPCQETVEASIRKIPCPMFKPKIITKEKRERSNYQVRSRTHVFPRFCKDVRHRDVRDRFSRSMVDTLKKCFRDVLTPRHLITNRKSFTIVFPTFKIIVTYSYSPVWGVRDRPLKLSYHKDISSWSGLSFYLYGYHFQSFEVILMTFFVRF